MENSSGNMLQLKTMQGNIINTKIKNLIKNATKFDNMQFRLLLEGLVKQGGADAENLVGYFATDDSLDSLTRINIIRIMGVYHQHQFSFSVKKNPGKQREPEPTESRHHLHFKIQ